MNNQLELEMDTCRLYAYRGAARKKSMRADLLPHPPGIQARRVMIRQHAPDTAPRRAHAAFMFTLCFLQQRVYYAAVLCCHTPDMAICRFICLFLFC